MLLYSVTDWLISFKSTHNDQIFKLWGAQLNINKNVYTIIALIELF